MNTRKLAGPAGSRLGAGKWMMSLGAAAALVDSVFNYFWPGNGINGTWGALGVIGGSLVILLVSLLGWRRVPWWGRAIWFLFLLAAILGNGFCAWLLEVQALQALMAFTLLGWLVALFSLARPAPTPLAAGRSTAP